jgi:hypothetical protein
MHKTFKALASRAWRVLNRNATVTSLLLVLLTVAAAAGYITLRLDPVGILADKFLSNARPPPDRELPQTARAVPYGSEDVQVLGGQGKELSCSIPWLVELAAFPRLPGSTLAPISLQMRQACAFHDYCYRHGAATYGYTQADCDYLLLEHAYRICRFINRDSGVATCVRRARKVLLGVRVGGSDSFKRADRLPPIVAGDLTTVPKAIADAMATPCPDQPAKSVMSARADHIDETCASSYFEFDPYPVRSSSFTVYRVADAPRQWTDAAAKALYIFDVRPAATRVTLLAWRKDMQQAYCAGYELPGRFDFLSVAPQVTRSGGANGEDWLFWWRRYSLEQTGGYLAILAPGRASPDDWSRLFEGAHPIKPANCVSRDIAGSSPLASRKILIGDKPKEKKLPNNPDLQRNEKDPVAHENDDPNISELHPAPGLAPDGHIRLIAMRTHTCEDRRVPDPDDDKRMRSLNTLCHHDIVIKPEGERLQRPEPYTVRDEINRRIVADRPVEERSRANDGLDPDRYRNFVTAPIALAGKTIDEPVIAWLRRGEARGETYQQKALLRRASHVLDKGTGLPVVLLDKFDEGADPVSVLGRNAAQPSLVSLRQDSKAPEKVLMHRWEIPAANATADKLNANCHLAPKLRVLNDCAQFAVPRKLIADGCTSQLDDSWLVRPPVVLPAAGGGADIMFFRMIYPEPHNTSSRNVTLEVKVGRLETDAKGTCSLKQRQLQPINPAIVEKPTRRPSPEDEDYAGKLREWIKETTVALTGIRARPALVADLDGTHRYVIVPDAKDLKRTAVLRLQ